MRLLLALVCLFAAPASAQTWTPTSSLPDGYNGHTLVASGGFLYNIGGLSLTNGALDAQRVFSAAVRADGSLSAWTQTTPMPSGVFYHAGVAARGFVYTLGGYHYDGSLNVSNGVYYAKQNADGTLGAWQNGTPLPTTLFYLSAAFWNGKIYVTGGWDGQALSSGVYSAVVNADGSLGPWVAQRSLPEGVYTHAAVSDGTLYVLGGVVNGGTQIQNTVYAAAINADGTLAPWMRDNPLPIPVSNHGAAVAAGRVYVLGGWDGMQQRAEAYSAASGQSLGAWATEPPLPLALEKHSVAVWNGRLYVSGGNDPVQTQAGVYWRTLPPPPAPTDVLPPRTTLAIGLPRAGAFIAPSTPLTLSAVDDLKTVGDGAGLGVAATYWAVDSGTAAAYAGPLTIAGDGPHWLRYYSVDTTGNAEAVQLASAAVDGTAPVSSLSIGAPQAVLANGTVLVSSWTWLSASATDPLAGGVASGVSTLTVTVDGAAVNAAAPFLLPAVDGPHAVSLRAVDAIGNAEAAHGQTVFVHLTVPVTTLTPTTTAYAATDGGAAWLGAAAALVFNAVDPVADGVSAGINRTEYSLDSAAVSVATSSLVLAEGSHGVAFRSVDNVGNAERWKQAGWRVDVTPPQTTFTIGSPVMMLNGKPVVTPATPLSLAAVDPLSGGVASGVKATVYSLDGGADQAYAGPLKLAVGAHTLSYGSVDIAGNVEPRRSVSLAVQADDTLPPRTTLSWLGAANGSFVAASAAAKLSSVDDLSVVGDAKGVGVAAVDWSVDNGSFTVYAGTATLAEGAHWLRYFAADLAGNAEAVHVTSVSVDGTAPVSTLSVGAPQAALAAGQLVVSSSTLLSAQAADPVSNGVASGVSALTLTVDGKAVNAASAFALPAVDGAHVVSLQAVDAVGNAETAHAQTVYVDQTAPATALTPTATVYAAADGGAPWLGAAAALAFAAQDPLVGGIAAGVNRTEFSLDGAPVAPATASLVLAEGAHTVSFRSVDNVGNAEAWKTASYRVDAAAPQTTFTIGSPVMMLSGKPVVTPDTPLSLAAVDPLSGGVASGIKATVYSLDGGADQAYAGAFKLAVGAHTLSYGSVDNAGNAEPRRSVTLAVQADDTLPPRTTLSWLGATSGPFVAASAAAKLSSVDDLAVVGDAKGVGVASIDWSLDAAPFAVYAGTATFPEGAHWLRYYSIDLAGNAEAVHASTISVDGTAPVSTLSIGAPQVTLAAGPLVVSSSTLLSAQAADPVSNGVASGVSALTLTVDGKAVNAASAFALPAADGAHVVSLQAVDAVGNAETAHAQTVYVDQTAPATALTPTATVYAAADGGAPWLGAAAALAFAAQDPLVGGIAAGVNRTEFSLDGAPVAPATASLVLAEGAHTVSFRSVDNVGNAEAWKTASYRVDAAAPQTTFTIGSPVMMLNGKPVVTPDTPLSLAAVDPLSGGVASGVKATVYSLDGGADQAYAGAFKLAVGAHSLSYGSVDNAGNAEPRRSVTLSVQPDDRLPPRTTLSWLGATSGPFVAASAAAKLSAIDDLATVGDGLGVGVASIDWSLDAAPFSVYAGTATFPEGAHWLRYYSVDLAGNAEAVRVSTISVDGTAPVSTLSVGAPQATLTSGELIVSSSTLLSASASDPVSRGVASGVSALAVTVDGKTVSAVAAFSLPAVDGAHAVALQAVDAVGNAEASHSQTVYVDQTPPVTAAAPTAAAFPAADGGAAWLGASAALAFTAQDPAAGGVASGVGRTDYALDGGPVAAATATLILAEGARTVSFRSVDNVGNAEAWKSVSYRVDATAPQTTLALGTPVLTLFGKQLVTPQTPLSLSAVDPVSGGVASGVKTIVYSVDGGADQLYSAAFTLPAGAHTLSYGAVDNAGNAEPRQTTSIAVGTFLADAVAAGQSVTLSGGASVNGDARAPQVSLAGNSSISGQTYRQAPVEAVDIASAHAYAQASNNDAAVASSLTNGALTLSGKQSLTLPAGVYYFTGLSLSGQASVAVSGQAQVFVAGSVLVSGQAQLNAAGQAGSLYLFSDGASAAVSGKARAAFDLYAPNAAASFTGGGAVAGRLYAQTVALSGNAVLPSTTQLPASSLAPGQAKKLDRPQSQGQAASDGRASMGGSEKDVASARAAAAAPAPASTGGPARSDGPSQRAEDLPAAAAASQGVAQSSQTYEAAESFRPARPRPSPAAASASADAAAARLTPAAPAAADASRKAVAAAPAATADQLPARAEPARGVAQSSQTYSADANFRPARAVAAALARDARALSSRTDSAAPAAPSASGAVAARPALDSGSLAAPPALVRVVQSSQTYAPAAVVLSRPAPAALPAMPPTGATGAPAVLSSVVTAEAAPAAPSLSAAAVAAVPAPAAVLDRPSQRRPARLSAPKIFTAAPKAAFSLVDAQGSAVRTTGGSGVVVPPGAVSAGLSVTVSAAEVPDAAESKRRDAARAQLGIVPAGEPVQFGPEGTHFAKPVTIELPFDRSLLAAGVPLSALVVHYWNPQTAAWEPLPSTVDAQAGVVRAPTSHFSLYQVHQTTVSALGTLPSATPSALAFQQVFVYPNPARHGARPVVHVEVTGADHVDVSIFDLAGARLQQASVSVSGGVAEYPVDTGRLGSGVYLYVVKASADGQGSTRRTGRLAVIK